MSETHPPAPARCPRCQSLLTADAGGVCLRCLGEQALRGDTVGTGADANPSLTGLGSAAAVPILPSRPSAPARPPRRIGSYELIEDIGRGGMGAVYAAHHEGLGRLVALKVIAGGAFGSVDQETRFIREAQAAARLRHPGIVRVFDVGRSGDWLFYAMDLLEGGDLREAAAERPLEPRAAAQLVAAIADAVAHAHLDGIIHRDLKPSNILLDASGRGYVADFGLARWELEPAHLTRTGQILGTPAFMAPEQANGRSSVASDIYGLGAVLFYALTGRAPFAGDDMLDVLARSVREPAPAPSRFARDVPPALDAVCLRCLEKDPGARYASAAELAEDLRRWLEHGAVQTPYAAAAEARRLVVEARTQAAREGYLYHLVEGMAEKLARAVHLAPDLAEAHAESALLHTAMVSLGIDPSQARRDLARAAVEHAEATDPQNPYTRCARVIHILNIEGRSDEAWPMLRALAHELPDEPRILGIYSRACIKLGRWADAKSALRRRIAEVEPGSAVARQLLAYAHCHLREYDDAVVWMEQALRIDATPAYRRLCHIWYRWLADPLPHRALRELRALPEPERRERVAAWCESQILLGMRRPEEAFAVYHASVDTPEGFAAQAIEETAHLLRLARWAGAPVAAEVEESLRGQFAPGRMRAVSSPREGLQHAYAAAALGRRDEALALADAAVAACSPAQDAVEGARHAGANEFYSAPGRLIILAMLDERDRFFAELERLLNVPAAVDPRYLAMDPTFDTLRRDPRFDRIMAGVQIPIVDPVPGGA